MLDIKANNTNSKDIYLDVGGEISAFSTSKLKQSLRKKRSNKYSELISKLDSGQHNISAHEMDDLVSEIKNELGMVELHIPNILRGIIAKCYIGPEYEVHSLDMKKNICHHYKIGEPLDNVLEKARSLAMSDFYDYVEVYDNYCCAVTSSGDVSLIEF